MKWRLTHFFSSSKKEVSDVLVLDIGSAKILALVLEADASTGAGKIKGVAKASFKTFDPHGGITTNFIETVAVCREAVSEALKQAKIKPEQAVLGIAGERVKGSSFTVHYERLKPQNKIDVAELKNIVYKVQQKAFDHVRHQLSWEIGQEEIDIKLINAEITSVQIDGYKVTNPIGLQGKNVTVTVFNAFAPLIHQSFLQRITQELGIDLLSIVVEPYALARAYQKDIQPQQGAIFIDIGGKTTEIALVRDKGLEGTKMFAIGGETFTNRLQKDLEISRDEAEEIKIAFSKNRLSFDLKTKIRKCLSCDLEVWLSGVEISLEEFAASEQLPPRILLCGGSSLLPGITQMLERRKWVSMLPFPQKPKIEHLFPRDIKNIIDETNFLVSPQFATPTALASIAVDLVKDESILDNLLRKIIRLIQT